VAKNQDSGGMALKIGGDETNGSIGSVKKTWRKVMALKLLIERHAAMLSSI